MNLCSTISMTWLLALCLGLSGCTAMGKMGQVLLDPSIPVGAPGEQPSQFSLSLYASPTLNLNPNSSSANPAFPAHWPRESLAVNVSADNPLALSEKLQALLDTLRLEHPALSPVEPLDHVAMSPVAEMGSYQSPSVQVSYTQAAPLPEQATTPVAFEVVQLKDDSLLLTASYEALVQDLKKALGSTLLQVDDYRLMPGQFKFVAPEQIDPATRFIAVIAHYHEGDDIVWKRVIPIAPRGHQHALLVQFQEHGVVLQGQG